MHGVVDNTNHDGRRDDRLVLRAAASGWLQNISDQHKIEAIARILKVIQRDDLSARDHSRAVLALKELERHGAEMLKAAIMLETQQGGTIDLERLPDPTECYLELMDSVPDPAPKIADVEADGTDG